MDELTVKFQYMEVKKHQIVRAYKQRLLDFEVKVNGRDFTIG